MRGSNPTRTALVALPVRVILHDFTGHPFQVQLARGLAARSHDVLHLYAGQYVTGRGRLEVTSDDPDTLRIEPLIARRPMEKYSPIGRSRFELAYADAWRERMARERYDVVVTANAPLFVLSRLRRELSRGNWVLWHQDMTSLAVAAEATRKLPRPAADLVSRVAQRLERAHVRSADAVVAIGEQFLTQYRAWGAPTGHVRVIPNWAPLDDITPGERDNAWAKRNELPPDGLRLLYAGTLGRKHNPLLLLEILDGVRARGIDAHLVVCSEGEGADDLAAAAGNRPDVRILGFQPAEEFSDVLASADAVLALLEKDAAMFSVPSKVLSYLSAGRPIVGLMPADNPAATDIEASGGFTGGPDSAGATAAAEWLARTCAADGFPAIGRAARTLAEERFGIDRITDEFEAVLLAAAGH
jgi:colanic acid biosynthesis glycosyl transferase WcaI